MERMIGLLGVVGICLTLGLGDYVIVALVSAILAVSTTLLLVLSLAWWTRTLIRRWVLGDGEERSRLAS